MSQSTPEHPWPPHSREDYLAEATAQLGADLTARFAAVKLMVFDADGVLTAGQLVYGPDGEAYKAFHSHDGLGLVMARISGIGRAVLTGRNSAIVEKRCSELRFDAIKLGRFDKVAALAEILAETGCSPEDTLYMGDDLIDLPAMHQVGLPVAVPAAPSEVREFCAYTTRLGGGAGAVREVTDLVLKSAGLYAQSLVRLVDKAWHPTPGELTGNSRPVADKES